MWQMPSICFDGVVINSIEIFIGCISIDLFVLYLNNDDTIDFGGKSYVYRSISMRG